ncbi:lipoprotein-releasing ABC transporter permease subunit [Parasphingorhabdus sp. DH2-15]|uniref:lipoprotein-releasing ABC transporter permease subunit n=1 Tax=Parasphingorhabdus sp. DH2-15 TaxID=3444112 RepID=UPI003F6851EC
MLTVFERTIARRYLLPARSEAFIFLVATISMVAVMLGVAALIIVMSVMNGFRVELLDRIVGLNGHALIQGYGGRLDNWEDLLDKARKTDRVVSASPLIEQPLLATFNGRVEGIIVRGNDSENIQGLNTQLVSGNVNDITAESEKIAIGVGLAQNLGARVGDRITIINPQGRATPFGTVPREISYEIGAIFEIGVYDFDKLFVIMPIPDAQTLLLSGDSIGMIEITTENADEVNEIIAPLIPEVGNKGIVVDWQSLNASVFDALKVERVVMFVILSIIILVAVFNILSSLIMLVRAKTRDIAILRTMGASRRSILKVFVFVGTVVGIIGAGAGTVLGLGLLAIRQPIVGGVQYLTGATLWDPSVRFLTELPSKTDPWEVVLIVILAIGASFLATLFPAFKAANTDPVQVLRYD